MEFCGRSCRFFVMLAMTFGYFLVEIVFGYVTNSMALVADSFHMLSDVLALCIAFYCMKISKQRSHKNTFGWVRAEVLGALVNAVFLLALCFSIFVEAIKRLLEPEPIEDPQKILIVGSLGLVVNIIGIFMFHGHATGGHGHSHGGGGGGGHSHGDKKAVADSANRMTPDDAQKSTSGSDSDQDDEAIYNSHPFQSLSQEAHSIGAFTAINAAESASRRAADRSNQDVIIPTAHVPLTTDESKALTDHPTKVVIVDDSMEAERQRALAKKRAKASASQMNMRGVFLHILGDAFGSCIVIITATVCWRVDDERLHKYLDPALSLLMVCIIVSTTLPLLKETALILLQTTPNFMDIHAMKAKLLEFDGILAVHDFHVWRLAGQKIIATAHIRFRNLSDYLSAADKIKNFFHDQEIHSTTIQPEFAEMSVAALGYSRRSSRSDDEGLDDCYLQCPPEECDRSATCCAVNTPAPTTSSVTAASTSKRSASAKPTGQPNSPPTVVAATAATVIQGGFGGDDAKRRSKSAQAGCEGADTSAGGTNSNDFTGTTTATDETALGHLAAGQLDAGHLAAGQLDVRQADTSTSRM